MGRSEIRHEEKKEKVKEYLKRLGMEQYIPYIERMEKVSDEFVEVLKYLAEQSVEDVNEMARRYWEWKMLKSA